LTRKVKFETLAGYGSETNKAREKDWNKRRDCHRRDDIITLPPEEAAKAKARLRESGVAKFKIKEIEVKAIPSIRPGDHPVNCP